MSKVKIVLPEGLKESVAAVNVVAESIAAISEGMKTLKSGPLTEEAIILLIQANARVKSSSGKVVKLAITPKVIKSVLDSMESLKETYLK